MFGNCGGCNGGNTNIGGRRKDDNCSCLLLLLLLCGCNGFGEDNCCWNTILLLIILNSCGCGNMLGC